MLVQRELFEKDNFWPNLKKALFNLFLTVFTPLISANVAQLHEHEDVRHCFVYVVDNIKELFE